MSEAIPRLDPWPSQNKSIALATVIDVFHSAPRGVGAKMLISSAGEMKGSVSAGCVEGAVVEEAQQVMRRGIPRRLHYGIADERAWEVGLTCGGNIEIFVEPLQPEMFSLWNEILAADAAERPFIVATVVEGSQIGQKMLLYADGSQQGSSGIPELDEGILQLSQTMWGKYRSELMPVMVDAEKVDVFFDMHLPPERLIVVGATHIAIHLTAMAKQVGFKTIVVDPRSAFAKEDRFPQVDALYQRWPQEVLPELHPDPSTYLVILSHDAKIDLPALEAGLSQPFRYIGLLGSRATQEDRKLGLKSLGYSDEQLKGIHGPIGISIGSRLPEEIAVSILAEMIAVKRGKLMSKAAASGPQGGASTAAVF